MRIQPNRHERQQLLQEILDCKKEIYHSQVCLVLDQTPTTIENWMRKIAIDMDENALIETKIVLPMVATIRPETDPFQPEPSMGSVVVLALPEYSTGAMNREWLGFEQTTIWQRIVDFYGELATTQMCRYTSTYLYEPHYKPRDYSSHRAVVYRLNDPETPLVVLVRTPPATVTDSTEYRTYAQYTFAQIFKVLKEIEHGKHGPSLPPRRMQRRVMDAKGETTYEMVRSYGYDAEILLNGVVGDPVRDEITAEEFWKAFITYLRARTDNMEELRGIAPSAEETTKVMPPSTAYTPLDIGEAANDDHI